MFNDPISSAVLLVSGFVGVWILFWWQDFEGIRSAWKYHKLIRKRERLTGAEFYLRFHSGGDIPAELVVAVRDFHATFWGENPELLRPEDDLFVINAGADFADYIDAVRKKFGVPIPETATPECLAAWDTLDGSFDSIVRCVHVLLQQQKSN